MLVLSRKHKESVVVVPNEGLGDVVRVTVLEIGPGSVRLGFNAGRDIVIRREEVWEGCPGNGHIAPPIADRSYTATQ